MEPDEKVINSFSDALKNFNTKRLRGLYSEQPKKTRNMKQYRVVDVISDVSKQLLAIQKADKGYLSSKKWSNFIPSQKNSTKDLTKLMESNKFETQCISDTQLVNLIEDAEAVTEAEKGITQEFELSFCLQDIEKNKENNVKNYVFNDKDITSYYEKVNDVTPVYTDNIRETILSNIAKCNSLDTHSNICFNSCDENSNSIEDKNYESERIKSPILNKMENKYQSNSESPLIFKLEVFEKFEAIALPVIKEYGDIMTAKKVINSQIINQELFIHIHPEPVLTDRDKELSDILNIEGKGSPAILDCYTNGKAHSLKEDSILFSSDEENDIQKDLHKLPMTCPLQSQFQNKSDILDETMYVGFQTASDKSIQVYTESFNKAKSIFEDVIEIDKTGISNFVQVKDEQSTFKTHTYINENSCNIFNKLDEENKILTQPVEIPSNIEFYQKESNSQLLDFDIDTMKLKVDIRKGNNKSLSLANPEYLNLTSNENYSKYIFRNKSCPVQCGFPSRGSKKLQVENQQVENPHGKINLNPEVLFNENVSDLVRDKIFEGFKTASNKKVKISENALAKTKHIFQDINIVDNNPNDFKMGFGFRSISNCPEDTSANYELLDNKNVKPDSSYDITIEKLDKQTTNLPQINKRVPTEIPFNKKPDYRFCDEVRANIFKGFKTASNKKVIISESAFAKTKNVFQDINIENNIIGFGLPSGVNSPRNSNFSTHNNADSKSMPLWNEINTNGDKSFDMFVGILDKHTNTVQHKDKGMPIEVSGVSNIKKPDYPIGGDVSDNVFEGFKTASNKKVIISVSALSKTKSIFKDIDIEDNRGFNMQSDSFKPDFQEHKGSNLSNPEELKSVELYKPELDKPETNLQNIYKKISVKSHEILLSEKPNFKHDMFQGFKTASNKKVIISENALAKTKNVFQNINIEDDIKGNFQQYDSDKANITRINKISDNCDTRINSFVRNYMNEKCHTNSYNIKDNNMFQGFQTASNKPVKISTEALYKSRKIFQEMDVDMYLKENPCFVMKSPINTCQGFKSAGNKPVVISADALAKSRKVFQDIVNDFEEQTTSKKTDVPNGIDSERYHENITLEMGKGLQNKKLDVHKTTFNDLCPGRSSNKNLLPAFGFQTANNKGICVSEEALKKSKVLFSDLDDNCIIPAKTRKIDLIYDKHDEENFDTEVIRDFESTVYTEDFLKEDIPKSKRSGSPILSCPKAKKRTFETPIAIKRFIAPTAKELSTKLKNTYIFDENYKKTKKYTLEDVNKMDKIGVANIDPYILNFQFDTLLNFEFIGNRNDIDNERWTTDKIKENFTDSTNRNIIPDGWIENHLKLIIWKLLSYEVRFPRVMENLCTLKNVLEQLKYRYNRELYNVERPALRKILEKDDIPDKGIILCVAGIFVDGVNGSSVINETGNIELLLTDGWYTVKATTDHMINKLLCDKKIGVGTKLVIHGAKLLNCDQGISPWEDTSAVRLKISGNSTRRAKWDARLGFHGNGAILTHLSAVKINGGKISQLRTLITRVYPTLYIEKFPDGSTITRSERLEHIHQMKYETDRQFQVEKLYEELEKLSGQDSEDNKDSEGLDDTGLDSGSQISRFLKKCRDPEEFKASLTHSQARLLQQHQMKRKDKLLEDLQKKFQELVKTRGLDVSRNVVPLIKMRVADVNNGKITKAMITVWRPNETLQELLTEGTWIDLYNVVPTSYRNSELQISTGRQSVFSKTKSKECDKLKTYAQTLKRQCYTIKDLQNSSMNTDYNEVDTIGIVFLIEPSTKEFELNNQPFQNIYLCDLDKNIICVNFWGGVKKFGFNNILDIGQVVTCVNLQKRAGNTRKKIPQYRSTEFTYFTKTSKIDSVRKMADDLASKFRTLDKRKFIDDCIALKNNFHNIKYGQCENISPYRLNTSDYNISKNKVFIDSPLVSKCTDVNLNLTGLDFESTFKQTDTQDLSPKTLSRKRKVNERIAKLKKYGEPPPLSPIHMLNKSKDAIKPFKSPLTHNSSPNVARINNVIQNGDDCNQNREESSAMKVLNVIPIKPFKSPLTYDISSNVARIHNVVQNGEESNVKVLNILPQNRGDRTSVTSLCALSKNDLNHCDTSPVLVFNRTYLKRPNINPVKLNFTDLDKTDPFAEDFDGSPPLSLE